MWVTWATTSARSTERIGPRWSASTPSREKSLRKPRRARATGWLHLSIAARGSIATTRRKKFLSLYPYSGAVIASASDALSGFETTSGSIHFSADHQLSDPVLRRIVEARRTEIDAKAR